MPRIYSVWIIFLLLCASCQMPAPLTLEPTSIDPQALFTSAAQTAEAKLLETVKNTPTLPAESLLSTLVAVTPTVTSTLVPPAPTGPIVATVVISATYAPASGDDRAEFVADITVPDGTAYKPNEHFIKTWRFKNIGVTTWSRSYALVFINDALLGALPVVNLPKETPPGDVVDVSVQMVAPAEPGIYKSFWKLRNSDGQIFGAGSTASDPFWVIISVSETAESTPVGTVITMLSLKVDNGKFTGTCPHRFIFSGQFSLNQAATVFYSLEAGSASGVEIKLPPPVSRNLEPGPHTIVYEVIIPNNMVGWARLHITSPDNLFSNQVDLNLVCQ